MGRVRLTGEARRSIAALPGKVRPAVVESLARSVAADPYRVGHALFQN